MTIYDPKVKQFYLDELEHLESYCKQEGIGEKTMRRMLHDKRKELEIEEVKRRKTASFTRFRIRVSDSVFDIENVPENEDALSAAMAKVAAGEYVLIDENAHQFYGGDDIGLLFK